MVETFQGAGVIALALLPGALYVWSFERVVGRWGIGLSDRILRFVGGSAIFQVATAPLIYWLYAKYIVTGHLKSGQPLPLYLWALGFAYVTFPIALGSLVGIGAQRRLKWARLVSGSDPAPRAWDHLFGSRPKGWMRLRLNSGVWVGGPYLSEKDKPLRSYAAGFPHPQDIYLSETAEVDPVTGKFVLENGKPRLLHSGILVKWDQVEYLVFEDRSSNE